MGNIKYYFQLTKFRLSITVVFSAMAGYFLGVNDLSNISLDVFYLFTGGFFVTGSANAFNQILERNYDKLMQRTKDRPLARDNIELLGALIFSFIIGLIGLYILYKINPYCCYFGLLSIALYVLCYTPLKRVSPISIFVGAIPGAIPFLLGWVASYDFNMIYLNQESGFELASGILFAIQFFWQFPHFISISWVQNDDYNRAGFKMMIGGEKGKLSAIVSIIMSCCLIFFSTLPFLITVPKLHMSTFGFITILTLGLIFLIKSIQLFIRQDDVTAKKLMFSSLIYLPLLQILLIIDKYFIT